jgi:hypothetical protein
MTKLCRGRKSCAVIMPKYAKIFNLWALELGQTQRATCSIACLIDRERIGRGSARPAPRVCTSPSHTQSLTRARDRRSSPWKASTTARHHCPSTAVVASPFGWTLASPQPLDRFPVKPGSFSKPEPRHCLTGEANSPSPEFGHPPPHVNRANQ